MNRIIRRQPRMEWIKRNRLHPQHVAICHASQENRITLGPLRKYPHAISFIGPQGIKRIDREKGNPFTQTTEKRGADTQSMAQLPLHRVEQPEFYIVVVPDMVGGRLSEHDRDIIGQAHQLIQREARAGAVVAVVFGEHREDRFDQAGVDRLLHIEGEHFTGYCPEQQIHTLLAIDTQLTPRFWLFPDSSAAGFELGCRFAARHGIRPATQVWRVEGEHCICRAAGGSADITRPLSRIMLLLPECAPPIDETRHQVLPLSIAPLLHGEAHIEDCGVIPSDPATIPLEEAEFILSAGNGVSNWAQFHTAAEVLGATEGASRVAVDNGHMPRSRQVGATGSWVTARVYVAVGISGAVQHLQGITQCQRVIAINTDPGCDMISRASLSVITESDALLAELIRLTHDWRKEELNDAA